MSRFHSIAAADVWVDDIELEHQRFIRALGLSGGFEIKSYPDWGIRWSFLSVDRTCDLATEFGLFTSTP